MGWKKRSSKNKNDSIYEYGFDLGDNSKKRMKYKCMSKWCSICAILEYTEEVVEHECPNDHDGSSKLIECEAIERMVKDSSY